MNTPYSRVTLTPTPHEGATVTIDLDTPTGPLEEPARQVGAYLAAQSFEIETDPEAVMGALDDLSRLTEAAHTRALTLALIARVRDGRSLREVARYLDMHHSTVDSALERHRNTLASAGMWVDARGLHRPTPQDTLSPEERRHVARAIADFQDEKFWRRPGLWFVVPEHLETSRPTILTAHWDSTDHPGTQAGQQFPVLPLITLEGGPYHGERTTTETMGRTRMALEHRGSTTRAIYTPDPDDWARWTYQGESEES